MGEPIEFDALMVEYEASAGDGTIDPSLHIQFGRVTPEGVLGQILALGAARVRVTIEPIEE